MISKECSQRHTPPPRCLTWPAESRWTFCSWWRRRWVSSLSWSSLRPLGHSATPSGWTPRCAALKNEPTENNVSDKNKKQFPLLYYSIYFPFHSIHSFGLIGRRRDLSNAAQTSSSISFDLGLLQQCWRFLISQVFDVLCPALLPSVSADTLSNPPPTTHHPSQHHHTRVPCRMVFDRVSWHNKKIMWLTSFSPSSRKIWEEIQNFDKWCSLYVYTKKVN